MTPEALLTVASGALERLGARLVHATDETVTVENGIGPRKRRLEVALEPLTSYLEAHPKRARAGIASFFRGLAAVALEPRLNRRQAGLDFAGAAGRLMPSLEGPLFQRGVSLAMGDGDAPFGHPTLGDLWVAHYLELDTGRRLVTRGMVGEWDVSDERVTKAALSLVFHRSYEVAPQPHPLDDLPQCQAFHVGDSYDATRALILDSLLYQRALSGLLVALPTTDLCLVTDAPAEDEREGWAAFEAEAQALYDHSAWPLTPKIYRVHLGPLEEVLD